MFIFEITIIITLGVYVAFLLEIKYIEDIIDFVIDIQTIIIGILFFEANHYRFKIYQNLKS